MAFAGKAMRAWTTSDVEAFFLSQNMDEDVRGLVLEACRELEADGATLVSDDMTVEDMVDAGVDEDAAAVIAEYVDTYKDSFPRRGGDDPSFDLAYRARSGATKTISVKGSYSVGALKDLIAEEEDYTGGQQAVRLVQGRKTLQDNSKLLRDVGLDHHNARPFVSVVFGTKGGAAQGGDEVILARTMGKWEPRDVAVWLRTLQPTLQKLVPVLVDAEQMTGTAVLAATEDKWKQLIPNKLRRRLFTQALAKLRAELVARAEFSKRRRLKLTHPLVKVTRKAECIPYTEDAEKRMRAEMPCGHAIGPNNLFRYFYTELVEKSFTTKLVCPVEKCDEEWPWHVVFAVCGLTAEEVVKYQDMVDKNVLECTTRTCPHCAARCDKPANITHCRVHCVTCGKRDFCWECSQPWVGGGFQFCGNAGCDITERMNEILQTCDDKDFDMYKTDPVPRGPSIRMCPHGECRTLVAHERACKHMVCPSCKKNFCFFCLDRCPDGKWGCGGGGSWSFQCPFAPRQKLA